MTTFTFTRLPKMWAALLHLSLIVGSIALFLGRKPGAFRSEALVSQVPDFYLHVSNASISLLLYQGVGFLWLMLGARMTHVAIAGACLVVVNMVYEAFLPILNTRDMLDAWYGLAGTTLGCFVLWIIDARGMILASGAAQREQLPHRDEP